MTEPSRSADRGLLRASLGGLHAVLLLLALVVPGYAVVDAVAAVFDLAHPESLATLRDLGRWSLLLGNTAVVCGVAVLTAGVLGGLLGLLITRTDMPGRRLLTFAALFGVCVPVYVSAVFFLSVVSASRLTGSALVCGFMYGLVYTPLAILVLGAAFRAVDRDLEEQALLDGGRWAVLRRVTLPQVRWGLMAVGMIVVLLVATDFTIADILLVRTFAEECYSQYQLDQRRAGPLLTALPVLLVLALLLVWAQARYRLLGEHSAWHLSAPPKVFALGAWRPWIGAACGVAVLAGLGVPGLSLLLRLRPAAGLWAAVAGLQGELWTSAALAAAGATLVVVPAVGLAWGVVRGGWLRWPTAAAVVLLLAVPAPVVGLSLIGLLNRPGMAGCVYDSPVVVVLGYFVRFLPIGVLLLTPGVQRVPREVEWAARVDGCDWAGLHWHIRWPAVRTDALLVWLLIVILCFGEVGATMLLAPPGWETASVRAFTLIHFGVYRDLAVLALLSTAFILLPWGLLIWLLGSVLHGSRGKWYTGYWR